MFHSKTNSEPDSYSWAESKIQKNILQLRFSFCSTLFQETTHLVSQIKDEKKRKGFEKILEKCSCRMAAHV